MPLDMWRERMNVDISFLQCAHDLRSALEGLAMCLSPVPHFVRVKDHLITFLWLNFQSPCLTCPPGYHPKLCDDHHDKL